MIGDNAISRVFQIIQLARIRRRAGDFLNRLEDRRENVGVVVARLVLQHRRDAFEAHAGVDVLGGQWRQAFVGVAVELDEDQVPDLDDLVRAAVDQLAPDLSGVRSMWISVQGPHGPVSPISQKLSFLLPR